MARAWTTDEDARLAQARAAGTSHADIAADLGRTAEAVTARVYMLRTRDGAPIPSRKRPSPWTPERVAQVRALRAEGLTPSQIATRVGSSLVSVGRVLRSPLTTEDSPGEGVRVRRTVPDLDRAAREVEQARAALARAEARHREAMEVLAEPVRAAIKAVGLVQNPEAAGDGEEDEPAWALLAQLRRRGIELRRVA